MIKEILINFIGGIMKSRVIVLLALVALLGMNVRAAVVFQDNFEQYDIENPSDLSVGGVATGDWTPSDITADASRTFSTSNFGGTRLWISNVDGTGITSRGIDVASNTDYSFSVVLVSETSTGSRQLNATYDILIGSDAASATSIIAGPIAVITNGDNWQIDDSKQDHIFRQEFSTGSLDSNDKLFIIITRVDLYAGTNPWFGVDDVRIAESLPIEVVAYDTTITENDPMGFTYSVYVKGEPASDVEVTITADNQLLVNGLQQTVLTFTPPVDPLVPQEVTVTAVDDDIIEGSHPGLITHSSYSLQSQWNDLDLSDLQITITDDDMPVNYASDVFRGGLEGPEGTSNYRIPGMTVAPDGTILAFAEGRRNGSDPGAAGYPIDMVMKRSTDNGQTWEPLVVMHTNPAFDYSDPRSVTDLITGKVQFMYMQWPDDCGQTCVPVGLGDNSSVTFIQTTDDNGQTWSGPFNINSQVKDPSWSALNCGPGHGIQLKWQTDPARNGRLVVPGHYNSSNGIAIYSDDNGVTWQSGTPIAGAALNESEVVELTNGDLLWDARWSDYRKHAISHDGGETWEYRGLGDIHITAVDCSIARFSAKRDGQDRDRVLFLGPLGDPVGSGSGRSNMGIWTSYDEGDSFINPVQIDSGTGAYSVIQCLQDGTIGALYEETGNTWIRFINCGIEQLEGGSHSADVTHYDGFGNLIFANRGGVGWSGQWNGAADFTRQYSAALNGSGVSFDGFTLPSQYGRVDLSGSSITRSLSTPITLNTNNSRFVSLLVSRATDETANDDVDEYLDVSLLDAADTAQVSFGVDSTEAFRIFQLGGTVSTSSGQLSLSDSYLLVLKVVSQDDSNPGNFDQVFLKAFMSGVDTIPQTENGITWMLAGTTDENSNAILEQIEIQSGAGAVWSVDEIRIGTTYETVAGNPACPNFLASDLNFDCYVDLFDLALFAIDWLQCTDPADPVNCVF